EDALTDCCRWRACIAEWMSNSQIHPRQKASASSHRRRSTHVNSSGGGVRQAIEVRQDADGGLSLVGDWLAHVSAGGCLHSTPAVQLLTWKGLWSARALPWD